MEDGLCRQAGHMKAAPKTLVGIMVGVALLLAATPAGAAQGTSCQQVPAAYPHYTGHSPRVRTFRVAGVRNLVVLPSDYGTSGQRRYPVLYLLHGADSTPDEWIACMKGLADTADRELIVVLPGPEGSNQYVDWWDGSQQIETLHIKHLLPAVDAHFRTIPDRAHRIVAGLSMGGFGAMHYAARHPDLFVGAASLSGVVDGAPGDPGAAEASYAALAVAFDSAGAFADPVTGEVYRRNQNPPDLAENLRATTIWMASGNGTPCDATDAQQEATGFSVPGIEPIILYMNDVFDQALTQARVAHTYIQEACGIHNYPAWDRYLPPALKALGHAIGRPEPRRWSYRTADPRFAVWKWRFRADPQRAAEFLDVRGASARGARLIGSGTEAVRTAPFFGAHQRVRLHGAVEGSARANRSGRIAFDVDLGPAHTTQEYSPGNEAAEAAPDYFTTRRVRFRPTS
jgi:S-formylglutathione hydrolase FrmB